MLNRFLTAKDALVVSGDGARDPVALRELMGHAPPANDMAALYRERIDDARLQAVVTHVWQWLFGTEKEK